MKMLKLRITKNSKCFYSSFQIVDAFDKAIELFNKNSEDKKPETQTELPEDAFVTEISFTTTSASSTTSTTSSTTSTSTPKNTENTTTRDTEEIIENSLPLKSNEIPRV